MRIPLQVVLLGLGIATATLIFEGAKRAMSGKHKRSPKQGDSPTAKEAKIARETAQVEETASVPTEKEVAAAEAARARLRGDQTTTASVRSCQLSFAAFHLDGLRLDRSFVFPDVRGQAARWT
jgi:hypothetical protein